MRIDFEYPIGGGRMTYWTGSLTAFLKYPADKQNALLVTLDRMSRADKIGLHVSVMEHADSLPDYFQLRELINHLVGDVDNPNAKPAPEITIVATVLARRRKEKCPICWEALDTLEDMAVATRCKHVFCKDCILSWVSKSQTCPVCRGSTRNTLVNLGARDLKTAHELLEAPKEQPEEGRFIRRSQRVQRILDLS